MFLVLVALPPLLSLFIPRPDVLRAMWLGWRAFGLAWQISWSPVARETAAPGVYVTWILWLIVLVGTIVIATRRPVARPAMRV
jgi:N-glycosylase/DNA lyase